VVLLDQATFPRDKVCGDGVSARGLEALAQLGLEPWSTQFQAPEMLHMVAPSGQVVEASPPSDDPFCYGRTIPRKVLDAKLAEVAVEAGAQLLEGVRVRDVKRDGARPVVTADSLRLAVDLVILADGSHAPISRRLGLLADRPKFLAVRQYLAGDTGPSGRLDVHFLDSMLPGYLWVFPMTGGRVNVGVGTSMARVHSGDVDLKAVLVDFLRRQRRTGERLAEAEPLGSVQGHPIRTAFGQTHTHAERLLVAGEAAGLVSPLSGEGIAPAMESGELAAQHALNALKAGDLSAAALSSYSQALRAHYAADWRWARWLRRVMDVPWLLNHAFRRLAVDPALALLAGKVVIGAESPQRLLRPRTLARLLF
jgi:geranylgeranyl reductase family protein